MLSDRSADGDAANDEEAVGRGRAGVAAPPATGERVIGVDGDLAPADAPPRIGDASDDAERERPPTHGGMDGAVERQQQQQQARQLEERVSEDTRTPPKPRPASGATPTGITLAAQMLMGALAGGAASSAGASGRSPPSGSPTSPPASALGPALGPALGSAHEREPTYNDFLEKLRSPAALDVVRRIKEFVFGLLSRTRVDLPAPRGSAADAGDARDADPWTPAAPDEDAPEPGSLEPFREDVADFLASEEAHVRAHALWRGASPAEWTSAREGLEKFVMMKIHSRAFAPTAAHRARDAELGARLAALRFVEPRHLDLGDELADDMVASAWATAADELRKMDAYKAPRDKLVCVMNCCRLVADMVGGSRRSGAAPASSAAARPGASADDFLSALILAVIRAAPPRLHSNVEYVAAYRGADFMRGETAYFFVQLASAVAFVARADHRAFRMSRAAFDAACARGAARVAPLDAGAARDAWCAAKFRFEALAADQVRVAQVPELLLEYKALVDMCRALLGDRDRVRGLPPGAAPPASAAASPGAGAAERGESGTSL